MSEIAIPPFTLDPETLVLYRDGEVERIPPKTIEVLVALLERRGELVTKNELMARVWPDVVVEESNLTVHVSLLRRTLGDAAPIETIPKRGYRIVLPNPQAGMGASAASRESVLRGRYFWNKLTRSSLDQAAASFRAALEADAANGVARAGLADTLLMQGLFGFADRSAFARAREHAEASVQAASGAWEARRSFAFSTLFDRWDFAGAGTALDEARRLAPDRSEPHLGAALLAAIRGDAVRAIHEAKIAREKDPLSLQAGVGLGFQSYLVQQLVPEVDSIHRTLELEPDYVAAHWALGLALDRLGRHEEAEVAHRRAYELSGDSVTIESVLARSLALAGRTHEAEAIRDSLAARGVSPYRLATIACALGDEASAIGELERSLAERDPWLVWVRVDPMLESLRKKRPFKAVVGAVFR